MSCFVDKICNTRPWNNGAAPMWTYGNSGLVRVGDRVFFYHKPCAGGPCPAEQHLHDAVREKRQCPMAAGVL